MKKNINVNISGLLFNIDEDAFDVLQKYLTRLKNYFGSDESSEEIINDIESRIAEMMQEKLSDTKHVITIEDVKEIIKAMGEPGEIDEEAEFEKTREKQEQKNYNFSEQTTGNTKRKLYRDPDDDIIGGVCSGLGYYFGISATLVRLIFIVLTLSGMSVLVYIILWIIIPEARTTAQKLEMRGKPVNIENIEKFIREEFQNLGNKFNKFTDKHFKKKENKPKLFDQIIEAIVRIATFAFKILLIVAGVALVIFATSLILMLIPAFITSGTLFLNSIAGIHYISIAGFSNLLFTSSHDSVITLIGLLLVVFIPLISLIYGGIRLITGQKSQSGFGSMFLILWITGILILILPASELAGDMKNEADSTTTTVLDSLKGDTLFVMLNKEYSDSIYLNEENDDDFDFQFYTTNDYFYCPPRVYSSFAEEIKNPNIVITKQSRASTYRKAKKLAEKIYYDFEFKNDTLRIAPLYRVSKDDKWRVQKLKVKILIPENKTIKYVDIKTDDPIIDEIQDDIRYRINIAHSPEF